jgi:mono/diheme cytochrome c family protein
VALRNTSLRRTLSLLVAGVSIVCTTAACGGGKPDVAHGRELFQSGANSKQACSFCHTLRAAQSGGAFAPNLDHDIRGDRQAGFSDAKITKLVRDMVNKGICLDPQDPSRCMPAHLVSGGNVSDVTAFVVQCSNRPNAPTCASPKPAGALAAKGQRLFGSLRCQGCHSLDGNVSVAPTVKGLAGSEVELVNGQKVTADDNYLTVSIIAPDAQIVKGYTAGYMSSVIAPHSVPLAQVKAIIAYIKTLK